MAEPTDSGSAGISELQERGDVEGLTRLLERPEFATRVAVVHALAKLDSPQATQALVSVFDGDLLQLVRTEAAAALAERGDPRGKEDLLAALDDDSEFGLRRTAAAALAALGDSRGTQAQEEIRTDDALAKVVQSTATWGRKRLWVGIILLLVSPVLILAVLSNNKLMSGSATAWGINVALAAAVGIVGIILVILARPRG